MTTFEPDFAEILPFAQAQLEQARANDLALNPGPLPLPDLTEQAADALRGDLRLGVERSLYAMPSAKVATTEEVVDFHGGLADVSQYAWVRGITFSLMSSLL